MKKLVKLGDSVGILGVMEYSRIPCSNGLVLPEKKVRKMHVKRTTAKEISEKWGFRFCGNDSMYFIRCNAKGVINWDKAPVYTIGEILNKNCVIL